MTILQIIFIIIFWGLICSFISLAPWVPTKKSDLERIHKLLHLQKWQKFLEIWCGTAQVSLYVANKFPKAEVIGIELSPILYVFSKIRVFFSGQKNISIIFWNALHLDFSKYDVLYVFGLPETISQKLFPKLEYWLKENAYLLSYCFQMKNNAFIEEKFKEKAEWNSIYKYSQKAKS